MRRRADVRRYGGTLVSETHANVWVSDTRVGRGPGIGSAPGAGHRAVLEDGKWVKKGPSVPDQLAPGAPAGRATDPDHHRRCRRGAPWDAPSRDLPFPSGWGDLNSRPLDPQSSALTKLRHSPCGDASLAPPAPPFGVPAPPSSAAQGRGRPPRQAARHEASCRAGHGRRGTPQRRSSLRTFARCFRCVTSNPTTLRPIPRNPSPAMSISTRDGMSA